MVTWEYTEWEWHKSLPVNGKTYEFYQFNEKLWKNTKLWWMFDVQAIPDNMKLKYQYVN